MSDTITCSLLSERCVVFLEKIDPDWRILPLTGYLTQAPDIWQTLPGCDIRRLGDLCAITPLQLLALGAKIVESPPEGTPLWVYLLQSVYTAIKQPLASLLLEMLERYLSQAPSLRHKQAIYDNGYSSLLIHPSEVLAYSSPTTITRWRAEGVHPVTFPADEIRSTPLLAVQVRNALREVGCDLSAIPLTDLPFSPRTEHIFSLAGYTHIDRLVQQTPNRLLMLRNFGVGSYNETASVLYNHLAPWFSQLPIETLVPPRQSQDFIPPPKATIPSSSSLEKEEHQIVAQPSRRHGKNALFFPVDAVLAALGRPGPEVSEDSPSAAAVSFEGASNNQLLSDHLMAALAANGCDLTTISHQRLFFEEGSAPTSLAVRTHHVLVRSRIRFIGEITSRTPAEILAVRNFGAASYRELVQHLHAFLEPWLDKLGVNPQTGVGLSVYEDPILEEESKPKAISLRGGVPLTEVLTTLGESDLIFLLDFYQIEWRHLLVSEVGAEWTPGTFPASLENTKLGDLWVAAQISEPGVLIAPEIATQVMTDIQQRLMYLLIESVLVYEPAEPEQIEKQQALAGTSIEVLLAEFFQRTDMLGGYRKHLDNSNLPSELSLLFARFGITDGHPKTLAEIGRMFGLSRSRIQQLEKGLEDKLKRDKNRLFMAAIAALVKWAIRVDGGVTTIPRAARCIGTWLPFGASFPEPTIKLLIKIATGITIERDSRLVESVSTATLLRKVDSRALSVLERHLGVLPLSQLLEEIPRARSNDLASVSIAFTAAAIASADFIEMQAENCILRDQGFLRAQMIVTLRDLGKPAHFRAITKHYNRLFHKTRPRSSQDVCSFLRRFPELFVSMRNDNYKLSESRCEQATFINLALERILADSRQPRREMEIMILARRLQNWSYEILLSSLRANPEIESMGNGYFALKENKYYSSLYPSPVVIDVYLSYSSDQIG